VRILILNWRDIEHPLAGGAELSLLKHAEYWHGQGAEITWFASSFKGAATEQAQDGMRVVRRGSHYTVHFWAWLYYATARLGDYDIIVDSFHFLPFFSPLYARGKRIVGLINEVARDVWHDNMPFPLSTIGYYAESLFFVPYRSRQFIAGSQSAKDDVAELGIPVSQITVVHHGTSAPRNPSPVTRCEAPTILFLNRVSEDKGIRATLEAYSRLRRDVLELQLWIAGKEEQPGMVAQLLDAYALTADPNITYFGYVSEDEKYRLMAEAWLLIHPSKREGWGLTVIEAAAFGTPTVAFDVAGLRDSIQNGVTGILAKDQARLVDAVRDIIADPEKRHQLGENCKSWSQRFDWDEAGAESWRLLNEAT
jgi:glycosyltransferase involved in cell wall biosynthesis